MRLNKILRKLRLSELKRAVKGAIRRFLLGRMFERFERLGIHVLPVHFYSPVPDTRELRRDLSKWYREGSFIGVDFNMGEQIQLLDKLRAYHSEYDNLPPYEKVRMRGFGEGYGEVEAHILHAMVRHLKSSNVIEVGSGISTFFTVNALSLNKKSDNIGSKILCVDPYPRREINEIKGDCQIEMISRPVQEISAEVFEVLNKGDILFIDSSHIVKINSDVNYLYFEVLPRLNEGVVIHIHDIPFPYPTPDPEHWVFRKHQFWTEAALVQAFLMYNTAFKILLSSSYLHYKAPDALKSAFSVYDHERHFPASLWLQKVS